jgi:hypothetical protein
LKSSNKLREKLDNKTNNAPNEMLEKKSVYQKTLPLHTPLANTKVDKHQHKRYQRSVT